MVKTMSRAQSIPHFGYSDEINMDQLVNMKEHMKRAARERGLKYTFMPVFVKV